MKKRIGALLLTVAMVAAYMPMLAVTSFAKEIEYSFTTNPSSMKCNETKDVNFVVSSNADEISVKDFCVQKKDEAGTFKTVDYSKKTNKEGKVTLKVGPGTYRLVTFDKGQVKLTTSEDEIKATHQIDYGKDKWKKIKDSSNYQQKCKKCNHIAILELVDKKASTCKENGLKAHFVCEEFNLYYEAAGENKVGNMIYDFTDWSNKDGKLPLASHTYGDWYVDSTTGMHSKKCSVCEDVLSHSANMDTAWTTAEGKHYHKCKTHGCTIKADEEACSGEWVEVTEGMGPMAQTKHVFKCSVCKKDMSDPTHAKHNPDMTTANCMSASTCKTCGLTKGEKDATNHVDNPSDVEWSKDESQHWKKCQCGEFLIAETAHDWGDGEVTTEPTCTEAGVRTFTCECGATKTEPEPATGHHVAKFVLGGMLDGDCILAECSCEDEPGVPHVMAVIGIMANGKPEDGTPADVHINDASDEDPNLDGDWTTVTGQELPEIVYIDKATGHVLAEAPTLAGEYRAEITAQLDGQEAVTAGMDYEITEAEEPIIEDDDDEEIVDGVKTGDANGLMIYLMMSVAAMAGTAYVYKRKED